MKAGLARASRLGKLSGRQHLGAAIKPLGRQRAGLAVAGIEANGLQHLGMRIALRPQVAQFRLINRQGQIERGVPRALDALIGGMSIGTQPAEPPLLGRRAPTEFLGRRFFMRLGDTGLPVGRGGVARELLAIKREAGRVGGLDRLPRPKRPASARSVARRLVMSDTACISALLGHPRDAG